MTKLTLDGVEYEIENISEEGNAQLNNLKFVNEKILQLNNELQIAMTARIGYTRAFKREVEQGRA